MARYDSDHNPWDPPLRNYGRSNWPTYPKVNRAPQIKKHRGGLMNIIHNAGNAVGRYGNQFGGPQRSPTTSEWLRGAAARKNRG